MRFNIVTAKFEDQGVSPRKLAVAGSDRDLTWAALEAEATSLAGQIASFNLPAGTPVLIRGHKAADMVVAMVACMMLDLPYVPLDISIPDERVRGICAITGAQLAIDTWGTFPADVAIAMELGVLRKGQPVNAAQHTFDRPGDPVRYVIFTSGSTGEPKGVPITREAAGSFLEWMVKDFGLSDSDVFVNQASLSFDLSVYELYTSLHLGASLLLNDAETAKDAPRFLSRISRYGGSVWVSTPTFAYLYLTDPGFTGDLLPSLHSFLFCGESLPTMTATRLLDRFPRSRVLNTYGPTEATVATTMINVTREALKKYGDMPVGYPKRDTVVRTVVPDGSTASKENPGEIEIIGRNVSIGYMGMDALNATKYFVENGIRGFRTGDYGWFMDGILFFSGRRDEQVKLNGFRIELGDIAAQMLLVPGVADAIAVPLRRGGEVKRIIGFVRAEPGKQVNELKPLVHAHLIERLPLYMVPADLVFIEAFPVNSSHKTDRQALIDFYLARLS